jgi:hypothetical protein
MISFMNRESVLAYLEDWRETKSPEEFQALMESFRRADSSLFIFTSHFEALGESPLNLSTLDLQSPEALGIWEKYRFNLMTIDSEQSDFFLRMARRPRDPIFPGPVEIERWGRAGEDLVFSYLIPDKVEERPSLRNVRRDREALSVVLLASEESALRSLGRIGSARYFEVIGQMGSGEEGRITEPFVAKIWIEEMKRLLGEIERRNLKFGSSEIADLATLISTHTRFDWKAIGGTEARLLGEAKDFILSYWANEEASLEQEAMIASFSRELLGFNEAFRAELQPIIEEADKVLGR